MKLASLVSLPQANLQSNLFSQSLAHTLQIAHFPARVTHFPDGELKVSLDHLPAGGVVVVQAFAHRVHEALIELFLTLDALKRAGVSSVYLLAPYFPYSRQGKELYQYESVAARLFAKFFEASGLDGLIALDLHDQHVASSYDFKVIQLSAADLLAQAFRTFLEEEGECNSLCVVAPDEGASRLAATYASILGATCAVVQKRRLDAQHVQVISLLGDVQGKTVLLADDVCSTAGTLTSAAKVCHEKGANKIYAAVSHGLFVGNAVELIRDSCIERIWTTDSCYFGNDCFSCTSVHKPTVNPAKNDGFTSKVCICPTMPLFSSLLRQYL